MPSVKSNRDPDFAIFAKKGDQFLNSFTRKLVAKDHRLYGLVPVLQSNKFINNFDCPWKLKNKDYSNPGMTGDMVEAWIWFLRVNYGPERAKLFILKQIEKTLPEFYKGFKLSFNYSKYI